MRGVRRQERADSRRHGTAGRGRRLYTHALVARSGATQRAKHRDQGDYQEPLHGGIHACFLQGPVYTRSPGLQPDSTWDSYIGFSLCLLPAHLSPGWLRPEFSGPNSRGQPRPRHQTHRRRIRSSRQFAKTRGVLAPFEHLPCPVRGSCSIPNVAGIRRLPESIPGGFEATCTTPAHQVPSRTFAMALPTRGGCARVA